MLDVGTKAPDFSVKDQDGNTVTLSEFKGKSVVLYFYPKDDTPGCTREGIGFSEKKSEFELKNAVVLGVSKDSVSSHKSFCTKYNLNISLLSDENMDILEPYGAWGEKKNYGKTYMGIIRCTFIIDPTGVITKVWKSVKVDGHVDKVLEALS
ncbi:MAG: thioredoxin-dependent thiol peroxidase [bacterium]|nr:thioredoxin-dependent thiol peroxidase [bacterium]